MTTAAVHEGQEAEAGHRPKYFVNIEGEEYPWDRPSITVLEIRLIGRLPSDQPVLEINLDDNTERTLERMRGRGTSSPATRSRRRSGTSEVELR